MYRIIIGDDDTLFLRELEGIAESCLVSDGLTRGEDFEIVCFQCPQALMDALTGRESAQLLLLDIEFGEMNGLEIAARLRERGGEFSLIYITTHEEYVFDSFDTRPLHYLLKPPRREKLCALLREDFRRQFHDDRLYLKSGGKHLSLPYRDIYAVEASQHRVLLYTRQSVAEWSGALSALSPRLPRWCFCQCHFSYFVNLSHVAEFVRYEARLDNGTVIPVSKRFYRPAFEQYLSFLKQ